MQTIDNPDLPPALDRAARTKPAQSWRDQIAIHSAAETIPPISSAELLELSRDIKQHGLVEPPVFWRSRPEDEPQLLDGRSRLDACELAGLEIVKVASRIRTGCGTPLENETEAFEVFVVGKDREAIFGGWLDNILGPYEIPDPFAFVLSKNLHRRHLSGEQKEKVVADFIKARPDLSIRQIAKATKADRDKVKAVRDRLESTGGIPPVEKTIGADGKARKQRGKKAAQPEPAAPEPKQEPRKAAPPKPLSERDLELLVALQVRALDATASRIGFIEQDVLLRLLDATPSDMAIFAASIKSLKIPKAHHLHAAEEIVRLQVRGKRIHKELVTWWFNVGGEAERIRERTKKQAEQEKLAKLVRGERYTSFLVQLAGRLRDTGEQIARAVEHIALVDDPAIKIVEEKIVPVADALNNLIRRAREVAASELKDITPAPADKMLTVDAAAGGGAS